MEIENKIIILCCVLLMFMANILMLISSCRERNRQHEKGILIYRQNRRLRKQLENNLLETKRLEKQNLEITQSLIKKTIESNNNLIRKVETEKQNEYQPAPKQNINVDIKHTPVKKQSTQRKKNAKTNVYVMIDKNTGYFKIGRSINPSTRERTLQSEKPTNEMLFNYPATNDCETELHDIYSKKRIRGEWFDLSGSDLKDIKAYFN